VRAENRSFLFFSGKGIKMIVYFYKAKERKLNIEVKKFEINEDDRIYDVSVKGSVNQFL